MAEFPALTLWTDAYLSDTRHLSTVEHGAYLLLLMEAWRRPDRTVPSDNKKLARIVGLSLRKWMEISETVLQFWAVDGDRLRSVTRCTQQLERQPLRRTVMAEVRARDGDRCRYCGSENGPFEFDHIHPWSRGGFDTADNICIACFACNRAKRDRTPEEMGWTL